MDQGEHYYKSWVLSKLLDRYIGSRELVDIRRLGVTVGEYLRNGKDSMTHHFKTGSLSEGFLMQGSDDDTMFIDDSVIVMYPDQCSRAVIDNTDKSIMLMTDTECQSGYVALEIVQVGRNCTVMLDKSLVMVGDAKFISSDLYKCIMLELFGETKSKALTLETHGPCTTVSSTEITLESDYTVSFPCKSWPREANEWVDRIRHNGWPPPDLIENIVEGGCHLVPVGDKSSADVSLQWRISFTTAERKLIHSFNHLQFLVLGLLKYVLKQISNILKQTIGVADMLSSYIMKTVMFCAIENTPSTFWHEHNTFICFWFCVNVLISWVKAGYCPNHFIPRNNMFRSKVHGENQQKLLGLLIDLHDMKWMCLSVGTFIQPTIGQHLQYAIDHKCAGLLRSPVELEWECDRKVFNATNDWFTLSSIAFLARPLKLLLHANTDECEFKSYYNVASLLLQVGMGMYTDSPSGTNNKQRYRRLRKCRSLMEPYASVCTSPGELALATLHYHTGNYENALNLCGEMIFCNKMYFGEHSKDMCRDKYQEQCCGRGDTLIQKSRQVLATCVLFFPASPKFCLSQFLQELTKSAEGSSILMIPPLPYAVFLSFLCYNELGDAERRDASLTNLHAVKCDEEQGGKNFWIVHTLLGICYETLGDTRRAIWQYRESMTEGIDQHCNPATMRIERLQHASR